MEKILISENAQQAEKAIDAANEFIEGLNSLVDFYNDLPVISALDTREKVVAFLSDKIYYFHTAILNETGITFGTAKPLPAKIAEMYAIPYSEAINRFSQYRYVDLNTTDYDKIKHVFSLNQKTIDSHYENAKTFTQSEAESEALLFVRAMCDTLNEYAEKYKIATFDRHQAAKHLSIEAISIKGRVTFVPNHKRIFAIVNRPQV
jgi:hypothetical protein